MRTLVGAGVGAAGGGLFSDRGNTLGGMIGGAALGALGGRYGGAGVRMAMRNPRAGMGRSAWNNLAGRMATPGMRGNLAMAGMYGRAGGMGVFGQARQDYRTIRGLFGGTSKLNAGKAAVARAQTTTAPTGATMATARAANTLPSASKYTGATMAGMGYSRAKNLGFAGDLISRATTVPSGVRRMRQTSTMSGPQIALRGRLGR